MLSYILNKVDTLISCFFKHRKKSQQKDQIYQFIRQYTCTKNVAPYLHDQTIIDQNQNIPADNIPELCRELRKDGKIRQHGTRGYNIINNSNKH